jgi:outer membrane lipoprotein-sorting protein
MHRVLAAVRRHWRWALVGTGFVALVALPGMVDALPADQSTVPADALVARILDSAGQPYHGYAEARGGLRLPELSGAADLSTLISDTGKMRLWYESPDRWRTDLLYSGGERDRYGTPEGTWTWDSGTHRSVFLEGETQLRLPIPIDVTPPDLGRRLLAAAEPSEITSIAPRRIAGRDADGLRITPASPVSIVDTIDLWADPETGLPVRVEVTARGHDRPSLQSGFLELEQVTPDPELVTFEPPPGSELPDRGGENLDLVQAIERYSDTKLPDTLAGLPRRTDVASSAATYGEGFDVVGVLALPEEFITDTLRALPTSERPWGQTVALVRTPLLNGMIFVVDRTAYIVGGPVTVAELDRVAEALVNDGAR